MDILRSLLLFIVVVTVIALALGFGIIALIILAIAIPILKFISISRNSTYKKREYEKVIDVEYEIVDDESNGQQKGKGKEC